MAELRLKILIQDGESRCAIEPENAEAATGLAPGGQPITSRPARVDVGALRHRPDLTLL